MDKKDNRESEEPTDNQLDDSSETLKDLDQLRDLIKDIIRHGPPSRRGDITGSGINKLKRLLEEIAGGKIKASVHVLGDVESRSGRRGITEKINDCLPCLEKLFADLYFNNKEDNVAHAGYICLKVLIECMRIDVESDSSESCNKLALTLEKFCDITGLNEMDHFKKGYHTFD